MATLALSENGRRHSIILHELAHIMTGPGEMSHGRSYCRFYLGLVERWLGPDEAAELKAAFTKFSVKWKKKRQPMCSHECSLHPPRATSTTPQCPACKLFMKMDGSHECPELALLSVDE